MLKFTNQLTSNNWLLVRKQLNDGTCSALIVMRTPRRNAQSHFKETCPPPPPPKSSKLLYGTIGAALLTGAGVVYAKHSPDTRNWLANNLPIADEFIALVYQENQTYGQLALNQFSKAKSSIMDFLFGKEGVTPMNFQQRSEQDLDKDALEKKQGQEFELPPPMLTPLYVEKITIETPEVEHVSTLIRTEKCDPLEPLKVNVTKDMVELEKEMHLNTKIAVDSYKEAMKSAKEYNKALFKVVESAPGSSDRRAYNTLKGARIERDNIIAKAKDASSKAKCAIETLERMIKAGVQVPPENVAITKRYMKEFKEHIGASEEAIKTELDKSVLIDRYRTQVEAAREMYRDELETLFPGVDLTARRLDIRGDTDLLLLYTMKQVQFLQNELAELQTLRELQITRAIECHDDKSIIDAKVEDMIKKDKIEKELEYQKRALEIEAEAHRKMKEQLKRQFEIQQDVMQDRVNRKEKEVMGKFSRTVYEEVEKERVVFKKELAAIAGKLQAIEQTLKKRAAAEAETKRSQSLWAAAEALLAATRRAAVDTKVDNEINALEKAGKDDKLVCQVLKGIPDETKKKGIITERALKDRFDTLEKTAATVALVGRDGASLPVYFLSWVQSKFLFSKLAEIPAAELNNDPTDFNDMDTFDIIQRARYHIDHGDLEHAIRYVNLLQGAPRAAAKNWLTAARRHLEVKQAAETVMAHASLAAQQAQ